MVSRHQDGVAGPIETATHRNGTCVVSGSLTEAAARCLIIIGNLIPIGAWKCDNGQPHPPIEMIYEN